MPPSGKYPCIPPIYAAVIEPDDSNIDRLIQQNLVGKSAAREAEALSSAHIMSRDDEVFQMESGNASPSFSPYPIFLIELF